VLLVCKFTHNPGDEGAMFFQHDRKQLLNHMMQKAKDLLPQQ
jgi:hypothetical protein